MAAPVLIFTDTERITREKAFLNKAVPYAQNVYNGFQAIGITVTLAQIIDLSMLVRSRADKKALTERLTETCIDALLLQAGNPSFNGVPIKPEKLRELITVPDVSSIIELLQAYYEFDEMSYSLRSDLVSLANGVISKVNNSDALIEAQYSYYTKTDKGAAIVGKLKAVADSLNDYQAYAKQSGLIGSAPDHTGEAIGKINGLEYVNFAYRPNLLFVQQRDK